MTETKSHELCIACQNAIPARATKCVTCGSFQNWRRFLVFSDTTLSLLVALLSVLGIVVPIVTEALSRQNSSMKALVDVEEGRLLRVLVSNEGVADGFVRDIRVLADGVGHLVHRAEFVAIPGGSSKAIQVVLEDSHVNFLKNALTCGAKVTLLESNLVDKVFVFDFKCNGFN